MCDPLLLASQGLAGTHVFPVSMKHKACSSMLPMVNMLFKTPETPTAVWGAQATKRNGVNLGRTKAWP